jgi:hypothetical protein
MHFVKQSTPNLSTAERFWRIQFTMGSVAFTMSSIQPLTEMLEDSKKVQANPEHVVKYLVPYLLAGLTSEPVDAVVIN